MKFKASLFASLFAAPLLATPVTSDNTFGIVKVESPRTATIISATWEACGGGPIKVKDVVTTTNLTQGDALYYWEGTTLKVLTLNASKQWEAPNIVGSNGDFEPGTGEGDVDYTVPRGTALVVVRSNTANPFYVYGQYSDSAVADVNIEGGRTGILACPKAADFDLNNSSSVWTIKVGDSVVGPNNGDMIRIPTTGGFFNTYTYRGGEDNQWHGTIIDPVNPKITLAGVSVDNYIDTTDCVIPAGEGFFYVNTRASGTTITISWL